MPDAPVKPEPPETPTALVPSAQATANLVAVPSTARRLAEAGVSPNTRRAYTGALRRLDTSRAELAARRGEAFSAAAPVTEAELVWYLTDLWEDGRAPASAVLVVAAARFRARLLGYPDPVGPEIERIMAGYRREGADWGRGQAAPLTAEGLAAILATCHQPRLSARGTESAGVARRRGLMDAALAGVLFHGGLRRSEAAALTWRDVTEATTEDGLLLAIRQSKTNQEGDTADVRYLKGGAARALRALRAEAAAAAPDMPVFGGLSAASLGRRFTAAAAAAGIERRLTAHSGRVGLASELTARGASTTETMLAGNWKTARMVAHYAAGATAERGAVAKYL